MILEQGSKRIALLQKQRVAFVMTGASVCEALTDCWRLF